MFSETPSLEKLQNLTVPHPKSEYDKPMYASHAENTLMAEVYEGKKQRNAIRILQLLNLGALPSQKCSSQNLLPGITQYAPRVARFKIPVECSDIG